MDKAMFAIKVVAEDNDLNLLNSGKCEATLHEAQSKKACAGIPKFKSQNWTFLEAGI